MFVGAVAATGATTGTGGVGLEAVGDSSALALTAGVVDAVTIGAAEGGAVADGAGDGAGGGAEELAAGAALALAWPFLVALELACASDGARACRAIAPVTESSPCSRTATRA